MATGLPLVTRVRTRKKEDGSRSRSHIVGNFRFRQAAIIETKLIESKAVLESGIHAMRGNLGYLVGIDRKNNAISNVSFWESVEAAEQMATFH